MLLIPLLSSSIRRFGIISLPLGLGRCLPSLKRGQAWAMLGQAGAGEARMLLGGLQEGARAAHFGDLVIVGAGWRGAASTTRQALGMFENLSALQPQPTLFSTPGARLHFGNPLTTSPCSHCSTCGCVHAACSRASLPALPHAAPGASAGEGGCGKGS